MAQQGALLDALFGKQKQAHGEQPALLRALFSEHPIALDLPEPPGPPGAIPGSRAPVRDDYFTNPPPPEMVPIKLARGVDTPPGAIASTAAEALTGSYPFRGARIALGQPAFPDGTREEEVAVVAQNLEVMGGRLIDALGLAPGKRAASLQVAEATASGRPGMGTSLRAFGRAGQLAFGDTAPPLRDWRRIIESEPDLGPVLQQIIEVNAAAQPPPEGFTVDGVASTPSLSFGRPQAKASGYATHKLEDEQLSARLWDFYKAAYAGDAEAWIEAHPYLNLTATVPVDLAKFLALNAALPGSGVLQVGAAAAGAALGTQAVQVASGAREEFAPVEALGEGALMAGGAGAGGALARGIVGRAGAKLVGQVGNEAAAQRLLKGITEGASKGGIKAAAGLRRAAVTASGANVAAQFGIPEVAHALKAQAERLISGESGGAGESAGEMAYRIGLTMLLGSAAHRLLPGDISRADLKTLTAALYRQQQADPAAFREAAAKLVQAEDPAQAQEAAARLVRDAAIPPDPNRVARRSALLEAMGLDPEIPGHLAMPEPGARPPEAMGGRVPESLGSFTQTGMPEAQFQRTLAEAAREPGLEMPPPPSPQARAAAMQRVPQGLGGQPLQPWQELAADQPAASTPTRSRIIQAPPSVRAQPERVLASPEAPASHRAAAAEALLLGTKWVTADERGLHQITPEQAADLSAQIASGKVGVERVKVRRTAENAPKLTFKLADGRTVSTYGEAGSDWSALREVFSQPHPKAGTQGGFFRIPWGDRKPTADEVMAENKLRTKQLQAANEWLWNSVRSPFYHGLRVFLERVRGMEPGEAAAVAGSRVKGGLGVSRDPPEVAAAKLASEAKAVPLMEQAGAAMTKVKALSDRPGGAAAEELAFKELEFPGEHDVTGIDRALTDQIKATVRDELYPATKAVFDVLHEIGLAQEVVIVPPPRILENGQPSKHQPAAISLFKGDFDRGYWQRGDGPQMPISRQVVRNPDGSMKLAQGPEGQIVGGKVFNDERTARGGGYATHAIEMQRTLRDAFSWIRNAGKTKATSGAMQRLSNSYLRHRSIDDFAEFEVRGGKSSFKPTMDAMEAEINAAREKWQLDDLRRQGEIKDIKTIPDGQEMLNAQERAKEIASKELPRLTREIKAAEKKLVTEQDPAKRSQLAQERVDAILAYFQLLDERTAMLHRGAGKDGFVQLGPSFGEYRGQWVRKDIYRRLVRDVEEHGAWRSVFEAAAAQGKMQVTARSVSNRMLWDFLGNLQKVREMGVDTLTPDALKRLMKTSAETYGVLFQGRSAPDGIFREAMDHLRLHEIAGTTEASGYAMGKGAPHAKAQLDRAMREIQKAQVEGRDSSVWELVRMISAWEGALSSFKLIKGYYAASGKLWRMTDAVPYINAYRQLREGNSDFGYKMTSPEAFQLLDSFFSYGQGIPFVTRGIIPTLFSFVRFPMKSAESAAASLARPHLAGRVLGLERLARRDPQSATAQIALALHGTLGLALKHGGPMLAAVSMSKTMEHLLDIDPRDLEEQKQQAVGRLPPGLRHIAAALLIPIQKKQGDDINLATGRPSVRIRFFNPIELLPSLSPPRYLTGLTDVDPLGQQPWLEEYAKQLASKNVVFSRAADLITGTDFMGRQSIEGSGVLNGILNRGVLAAKSWLPGTAANTVSAMERLYDEIEKDPLQEQLFADTLIETLQGVLGTKFKMGHENAALAMATKQMLDEGKLVKMENKATGATWVEPANPYDVSIDGTKAKIIAILASSPTTRRKAFLKLQRQIQQMREGVSALDR